MQTIVDSRTIFLGRLGRCQAEVVEDLQEFRDCRQILW